MPSGGNTSFELSLAHDSLHKGMIGAIGSHHGATPANAQLRTAGDTLQWTQTIAGKRCTASAPLGQLRDAALKNPSTPARASGVMVCEDGRRAFSLQKTAAK